MEPNHDSSPREKNLCGKTTEMSTGFNFLQGFKLPHISSCYSWSIDALRLSPRVYIQRDGRDKEQRLTGNVPSCDTRCLHGESSSGHIDWGNRSGTADTGKSGSVTYEYNIQ